MDRGSCDFFFPEPFSGEFIMADDFKISAKIDIFLRNGS